MIRERFNSLDRGCENGVKTLLQCRKLTCGRFGSKLDGQLCRTSRLRNGAEGMKGFVKRCYARKPETVLNLLRVVMGTQVTVEHVERPKRYETMEEVLEELRAYGIIPFEQKALPRYEGPKIEFDAKDVSDDDVAGWDGPRSRFRGRREADHGCSSTRQLLLVSLDSHLRRVLGIPIHCGRDVL
jgi:hypothetical protein